MTVPFSLTPGCVEPIYQQLVDQAHRLVASGVWAAGHDVPSVRQVAQALAVNPMTVSKAYAELQRQGVLARRRGLAMVVANTLREASPDAAREALLRPALQRAALQARQLGLSETRSLALFKATLRQAT